MRYPGGSRRVKRIDMQYFLPERFAQEDGVVFLEM
jgi:hypothetical protein